MLGIIALIAGLLIGCGLGWLLRAGKSSGDIAAARAQAEGADRELSRVRSEVAQLRGELRTVEGDRAATLARLEAGQKAIDEQREFVERSKDALKDSFKLLASDILEEKAKAFTKDNKDSLDQLLDPLQKKLKDFQDRVEGIYIDETKERSALKQELKQLISLNQQLSADANNLTRALTNTGKVQGDWGEFLLEKILEASGLRRDHEYFVQETFKSATGDNLRPDVVIHLPEGRALIVDSKVSLTAYNAYTKADNPESQDQELRNHLRSVRQHVKELSSKSYDYITGLKGPDFVIMFVPLEPAFMLAVAKDDTLWEDAYRGGVILVSPTTLLFVLRTVAQLWKGELQKQHVADIAKRGAELYDKLVGFVDDLRRVESSLDQAKNTYLQAYNKLATGKGNVIRQAEMLKQLGIKPKKELPTSLVEMSSQEELQLAEGEAEDVPTKDEVGD
jgi:DNA recombination protein RmuC